MNFVFERLKSERTIEPLSMLLRPKRETGAEAWNREPA